MGSTVFAVTLATLSQLSLASRPMITLMEHSNGFINQIKSFSQPPQHENRLRCSQPCQRLPNMVKLQPILIRYGVNKNIVDLIETNDGNSYGEIDIGRCAGSCRAVESESIRVSSFFSYALWLLSSHLILVSHESTKLIF